MRHPIVVGSGPTNASAYAPDVPGCVSTGADVLTAAANMREALEFHLQSIADDGGPLPIPCTTPILDLAPGDQVHFVDVRIQFPSRA